MQLRDYQQRAVRAVRSKWASGASRVVCVSPTGSGKTTIGAHCIERGERALVCAHTREIVDQWVQTLGRRFGQDSVSAVMPGRPYSPRAPLQIYSTATLVNAPEIRGKFDVLVFDECHHYVAPVWRGIADVVEHDRILGLTATPERSSGEPLGDVFEDLVVAAKQHELLAGGYVVRSRIFRPQKKLGADLAQDPVSAVRRYAAGLRTVVYVRRVEAAKAVASLLRAAGIEARSIDASTPEEERSQHVADFRSGKVQCITNVRTMTEGVDVPEVDCVVLAQPFTFVGGYLQAVGRGRRASAGKTHCTVIDLTGTTHTHGSPDEERDYSLKGRAIRVAGSGGDGTSPIQREDDDGEVFDLDLFNAETGDSLAATPLPPITVTDATRAADAYMTRRLKGARSPKVRDLIRRMHEQQLGSLQLETSR